MKAKAWVARAVLVLFAVTSFAFGAEPEPYRIRAPEVRIVTNLDGFETARLGFMSIYNTQLVFSADLQVRPEFTVMTNVGGFMFFLSAETNRISGRVPKVLLSVVNATASSAPDFRRVAGGEPLFGYCTLSNTVTGKSFRVQRPEPQDLVSVTGGNLLPGNHEQFPISLANSLNPKEPGTYALRFHGKMPYSEVEFETPPLLLTVVAFRDGGAGPVPQEAIERAIKRLSLLTSEMSDDQVFETLGLTPYRNLLHGGVGGGTSSAAWTTYTLSDRCVLYLVYDCSNPNRSVLFYANLANGAEGKPGEVWRKADALFLPVVEPGNIDAKAQELARAIRAGECRAAELDPEGHWGPVIKGVQVSLRSLTNVFVKGQPAEVSVIFRNTTTNDLVVPNVPGGPELRIVDTENHDRSALGLQGFSGPMSFTLPAMRQMKGTIDITDCIRDRSPGTYRLYARDYAFDAQGQWGKTIPVLSGDLSIRVVDK